jgi:hypothetical protein
MGHVNAKQTAVPQWAAGVMSDVGPALPTGGTKNPSGASAEPRFALVRRRLAVRIAAVDRFDEDPVHAILLHSTAG